MSMVSPSPVRAESFADELLAATVTLVDPYGDGWFIDPASSAAKPLLTWTADDFDRFYAANARRGLAELTMVEPPEASEADRAAWAEMTRDELTAAEQAQKDAHDEAVAKAEFVAAMDEYDSFVNSPAGRWEFPELAEVLGHKAYGVGSRGF